MILELGFTDEECIKAALKELEYPFEIHAEARSLYGYVGDVREQKANIIIRREHVGSASNDIGFLRKSDGSYELIISEYDQNNKQGKLFLKNLKQIYAKNKSIKQIKRAGVKVVSQKTTQEDGKLKIKIRAY